MPEENARGPVNETMSLIREAERAEKIRTAIIYFTGPCSDDHVAIQDINKAIAELSSLSCVLREIDRLIELDTGAGLDLIHEDLKYVHEDVYWTLEDVWECLGRLGERRSRRDYQTTWKEITEQSFKNDGKNLHHCLEGYRRFLQSLCNTLNSHVHSPTADSLRAEIRGIHSRRLHPRPQTPQPDRPITPTVARRSSQKSGQRRPLSRNNSTKIKAPKSPEMKQPKSYERERPMSSDDSSVSSASDATKFVRKPWAPSPPVSPAATMSSISQVSSNTPSLEASSNHWAKHVFKGVSSTPLPWNTEETRYHEVRGITEHSYPNQAYDSVLNLAYPEGVRISLFCRPEDYRAKIVAIYRDRKGNSEFGCLPLSDLHVRREGSILRLCKRKSSGKPIPWVTMKFTTIERLVLFAGTFIAMRAQDSSQPTPPDSVHDEELRDEICEFAGRLVDSGFKHGLRIYHDRITGAIRLQASVLEGDLDRTPVWTAFITHVITSPGWCRRVDKRIIVLAELQLHIFSARYRPDLAPSGAFMLRFETTDDADSFLEVLTHLRMTSLSF